MGRFLDLDPSRAGGLPPTLEVRVGDLLRFHASGVKVVGGDQAVDVLGAFTSAVLSTAGTVLAPQGGPNLVVAMAAEPGHASLDIVTGDPWSPKTQRTQRIDVVVAAR